MDKERRVAVITGGATGIGRASAAELARDGFKVVIVNRDRSRGLAAVEQIRSGGGEAEALAADVTDRAALEEAFGSLPRCDVLVNSAGAMSQRPFSEITTGELERLVGVNLTGTLHACQIALSIMPSGGRIINIASRAALGGRGIAHYAATKAGVVALTRSLAVELLERGITVNAVAPGFIDTPLARSALTAEQFEGFVARQPLGRAGRPEDVAWAVAFFASSRASFITGQCLFVDGGKSLPI